MARSATCSRAIAAFSPRCCRAASARSPSRSTEIAGLNGLALPGDRVDLILTYSVVAEEDEGGDGRSGARPRDIRASETVVRNIRLLALRQSRRRRAQGRRGQDHRARRRRQTATLEVTPRQAEQITLATTLGNLSLTLNSVRDGGEKAGPGLAAGDAPGDRADRPRQARPQPDRRRARAST